MRMSAAISILLAAAAVFYAVHTGNNNVVDEQVLDNVGGAAETIEEKIRVWTFDELQEFDDTDKNAPVMLVILGQVYDVSKGRQHYGKGQGYHMFIAQDASRAFVTGEFDRDKVYDPPLWDVTSMDDQGLLGVADWRKFYSDSEGDGGKYTFEGVLYMENGYYNQQGEPTEKLLDIEERLKKANTAKAKEKEHVVEYPGCNSKYEQGKGSWVWCDNDMIPRLGKLDWDRNERCACYSPDFAHKNADRLRPYLNCPPQANKCTLTTA